MPACALIAAVVVAVTLAVPQIATAGTYAVASCDAAGPTHNVNAWWVQGGSVNSYALCPSAQGGVSNTRLIGYPAQPGAASYTSGSEWPNSGGRGSPTPGS